MLRFKVEIKTTLDGSTVRSADIVIQAKDIPQAGRIAHAIALQFGPEFLVDSVYEIG
jgi:hypothetical protein